MVSDAVPGVVNADKEQQQRRKPNAEEGRVYGCERRMSLTRGRIRGQRQPGMKQPILKFWFIHALLPHSASHDRRVRDSANAYEAAKGCNYHRLRSSWCMVFQPARRAKVDCSGALIRKGPRS